MYVGVNSLNNINITLKYLSSSSTSSTVGVTYDASSIFTVIPNGNG